mmetsp:Transcript_17396/g.38046  ORF Transcript_17396/g.38046 Transcript_17396/m.38046 type:complete len:348 (+) Transcript_17396:94-1137(+)|eukprot:CAMPEP_0170609362 /NCGR_PEP_ID=MMETSP0224-20130122/22087_1 /TAXON_ID=285029 /ORGANISM="Togula jolla, Strain CCCM 725" /LENGTH=347 /DNA_ID=CAMNT_0010934669 /DNA_START=1 /DNA_END=1044 /DNA_ORIENTATION=-
MEGRLRLRRSSSFGYLRRGRSSTFQVITVSSLQEAAAKRKIGVATMFLLAYWMAGALYGMTRKGWSCMDSLYFAVVTISTVGYGDQGFAVGQSQAIDHLFGACYVFVGVLFVATNATDVIHFFESQAEARLAAFRVAVRQEEATFVLEDEIHELMVNVKMGTIQIILFLLVGALGMSFLEGWYLSDAFYWACVTLTTVGYGDKVPTSSVSKGFAILFILIGFGLVAAHLSLLGSLPYELKRLRMEDKVLNQFGSNLEEAELAAMLRSNEVGVLRTPNMLKDDASCRDRVSRAEFALWLLMKTGKVDLEQDVKHCLNVFDKLDVGCNGNLGVDDIQRIVEDGRKKSEW